MYKKLKLLKITLSSFVVILVIGLVLPEEIKIPVTGASSNDWNSTTYWYEPWGVSGVHKGIDIFGVKGVEVVAPTYGVTIFSGNITLGGKVVALLGPKWRIHYLAHLDSIEATAPGFVGTNEKVGTLGDTGNAAGKQPHVHYSIISLVPYPWLFSTASQGWKKMFILNPHEQLNGL